MSGSFSESYKEAGVDITAGYRAVELMKPHIIKTRVPGAVGAVGGFGGLFEPDLTGIENPVLVSGTDGVGTKLKIAFLTGKHDTVGIDCVAMCANDVVCAGAKPLFFLDYLAVGKNEPEMVADIVKGVAQGCIEAGCALIGGETAEMPGFYAPGEYDLAGFCVGLVSREKITDFEKIVPGDVMIGLASSGVHSNGFSLVRRALGLSEENISQYCPELGRTLGEELLTPTRIYVKSVLAAMAAVNIKGVSHITGGGFYENIPRMLPRGITARVQKSALPVPPVFSLIASRGKIPERDMYNTFNMGVGMVLACAPEDAQACLESLRGSGERAAVLGVCEKSEDGEKGVVIE